MEGGRGTFSMHVFLTGSVSGGGQLLARPHFLCVSEELPVQRPRFHPESNTLGVWESRLDQLVCLCWFHHWPGPSVQLQRQHSGFGCQSWVVDFAVWLVWFFQMDPCGFHWARWF